LEFYLDHDVIKIEFPLKFKARGGKLILYHGWNDAVLPPLNTINDFESVRTELGRREADSFMRLFMAPGLQHCADGPGPNSFGRFVTPGPNRSLRFGAFPFPPLEEE